MKNKRKKFEFNKEKKHHKCIPFFFHEILRLKLYIGDNIFYFIYFILIMLFGVSIIYLRNFMKPNY